MRRSWLPYLDDRDRDLMVEADAEQADIEAEYERWLNRKSGRVEPLDRVPADDAFCERDRADRLELEGGTL